MAYSSHTLRAKKGASPFMIRRFKTTPILCACVALVLGLSALAASAQSIPPQVLQELQRRQQSSGVQDRVTSPVDRARDQRQGEGDDLPFDQQMLSEDSFGETEQEEEDLPTALELDYQERLDAPELEQYGYSLLTDRRVQQTSAAAGRIGESYIVGIGDEFAIILQGNESQDYLTKVDSEGRLILRGLAPVSAAGRTVGDIRRDVESRVAKAFIGTEVYLSVAALEQINVIVSGEVEAPGAYQLTSQATTLDALVRAQGVRKTGSLRRISVLRGQKSRVVDLYRLFRGQSGSALQLRDGDQIIVPPLGDTYAVAGQVLRPGIFELPQGVDQLSARTAMTVAGGSVRPRGYELVLARLDRDGNEVVSQVKRSHTMIAGDGLVVVRTSARSRGKVSVSGHVAAPGMRALSSSGTVASLIQRSGGYLDEPYLPFASLKREDPKTLSRRYSPVNLLNDDTKIGLKAPLQDQDELIILSRKDVLFLSSDAVRQVVLTRQYSSSLSCRPLEELANLAKDIQTERFAAVLLGAFVLEGEGSAKVADVAGSGDTEDLSTVTQVDAQLTDFDLEQMEEDEREAVLADVCPSVYTNHDGLLSFVLEHIATISGSIRRPAVLPVAGRQPLSALVEFAGGLSFEASLSNVEVSQPRRRANEAEFSRSTFDLSQTPLSDISVRPGSTVFFQSMPTEQEPGTVLLSGEFVRPGIYTVKRGERLSSLIERAGGVTDRAYPFGAVFTRVSVKRAQDQAFKRTAREMNTALTTAALKNNVNADALAAARELTESMRSVEAVGRVVVEADPRVLAIRRDLDSILEPGDRLYMPKRPNHVLAMGDVLNPGALQFVRGKSVSQYLAETGGIQRSADEKRLFLVYPNGVARPLPRRFWGSSKESLPPGSTIVVPKNTDPLATLQLTREITSIVSQFALSAASFAVVFDGN